MGDFITLEVEGLDEAQAAAERVGKALPEVLHQAMTRAVRYVQGEVPEYPPEPPGSRYRRTATLGRSLTGMAGTAEGALAGVETVAGGVRGFVGSAVPYAPEVIGEEGEQAEVHQEHGWWRLGEVVAEAVPGVERILEEGVGDLLEEL